MRRCATYNDTGIVIDDCDRVNFIYGHNGSGKSTISNFLNDLQCPRFHDCSIVWDSNIESHILVYNKWFRERNLQATDIPGVFTLGEATAEQLAELKRLQEKRKQREKEYRNYRTNLDTKKQEETALLASYESAVWEQIFKRNDAMFKEAFTGYRNKKASFFSRIRRVYSTGTQPAKTRSEIEVAVQTLFGEKPERQLLIQCPSFNDSFEVESHELWGKVIVGNKNVNIAGLIESLNMSDWVKVGQAHIRDTGICPFCQNKTITTDLNAQFSRYFSGEYERQIALLNSLEVRYSFFVKTIAESLKSILDTIKILPLEIDFSSLEAQIALYLSLLNKNQTIISSKKSEPSRIFTVETSAKAAEEIAKLIAEVNEKISIHNTLVDNYKRERDALIEEVWKLVVFENGTILSEYEKQLVDIGKAISSLSSSINTSKDLLADLDQRIVEVNTHITSVQPTVDAINRSLKAYGFEGFSVVPSPVDPNRYQIKRPNGDIATETLSEGEETFISFLYFVYMTQGGINHEAISQHKIIVIDDPICSLDSSILICS